MTELSHGRTARTEGATPVALYDKTARDAAAAVIARYSTSFGVACRLLGPRVRPHVRAIYALVRVADEIVDGAAESAGLSRIAAGEVLDALEVETIEAIDRGFSANLIVHAFALTARECGIRPELIHPFFASMRTDLDTATHDSASHDAYVYGSAEVVGLMCLQAFVNAGHTHPIDPAPELVSGARRLGAAFQDVNFLRDLGHDSDELGRDYLGFTAPAAPAVEPGTSAAAPARPDAITRRRVLDRIDADLESAAAVIPQLPADCRAAVTAAHDLFAELSRRLRRDGGATRRVRVPDPVKARIVARALVPIHRRTARS